MEELFIFFIIGALILAYLYEYLPGILSNDPNFTENTLRKMEAYAGLKGTAFIITNCTTPTTRAINNVSGIEFPEEYSRNVVVISHELAHVKLFSKGEYGEHHEMDEFRCWEGCILNSYYLDKNVCECEGEELWEKK